MVNLILEKRWVILQHTLAKDSMEGLHYDLLLEDKNFCRTWRLSKIPKVGGNSVEAIPISPHGLYWLERDESYVSGGRGWAKRIFNGKFHGSLPLEIDGLISVELSSDSLNGKLELGKNVCKILFSSKFDFI